VTPLLEAVLSRVTWIKSTSVREVTTNPFQIISPDARP
jgi:hypothetical protein